MRPASGPFSLLARSRFLLCLLAAMLVLLSSGIAAAQSQRTRTITTEQMAGIILRHWDKVRVVFIYSSTCPACHIVFDDFVAWVTPYQDEVEILAFSTDKTAAALDNYLGNKDLPFERVQVEPWQSGDFDRALKPTGIDIGKSFGTPLFAVIDQNNKLVGQYEGTGGLKRARKWLASTGVRAAGDEGESKGWLFWR